MPLVETLAGEVPKEAHLAVMLSLDGFTPLPIGAKFLIVQDPARADRTIPVFLARVTKDLLVFRCNCGQGNCTRVLSYKLRVAGRHPTKIQGRAGEGF